MAYIQGEARGQQALFSLRVHEGATKSHMRPERNESPFGDRTLTFPSIRPNIPSVSTPSQPVGQTVSHYRILSRIGG
jgi:hypothetical protein